MIPIKYRPKSDFKRPLNYTILTIALAGFLAFTSGCASRQYDKLDEKDPVLYNQLMDLNGTDIDKLGIKMNEDPNSRIEKGLPRLLDETPVLLKK